MNWMLTSAVALFLLGSGWLILEWFIYQRFTAVDPKSSSNLGNRPDDFRVLGNPFESFDTGPYAMSGCSEVTLASRGDGVRLAGWYAAGNPSGPAVLLVHGWRQGRFDSNVLTAAGMLRRNGFSVLLIDLRNHGSSAVTSGHAAFGAVEYRDVLGAWDWLVKEMGFPPAGIGLYGVSMGAVTSLIAMAREPRVAAVFADSPFFGVLRELREQLRLKGWPGFLAKGGIRLGRILFGDDLLSANPAEAFAAHAGRPMAFVHSTADRRVPVSHQRDYEDLARRTGARASFWLVEGAGHVQSEFMFPGEYERRLVDFFGRSLARRGAG
jgi:dipeptidyl aminopeptidase/acylaminoacyl peptidase